jgi:hypothetical protein
LGDKLIRNSVDVLVPQSNKLDALPKTKPCQILRDYFVKKAFNLDGKKKRGQSLADARNATTRKVAEMVFEEMFREWNK